MATGRVLEFARLYRLDAATTDALYTLALGTQGKGWWEDYLNPSMAHFAFYLGLESTATVIQSFQPDIVLGLLQTPDYARAVERASASKPDDSTVEKNVEIRMKRQEALFTRTPRVLVTVILGAGALAREVGGSQVMEDQIAHIQALVKKGLVEVLVLPWAVGAHASMTGPFTIMRYGSVDDPTAVYVETLAGSSYFELPAQVDRYALAFDSLVDHSILMKEYIP
jgi:hypothetical protein